MHATLNLEGEITEFYQNFLMTKNVYQHFHKFLWGVIVSPLFKFLWYADFSKVFIHSVKSAGHSILLTQTKTNCLKRSCNLWAWLSKSFGFNSFDMLRFKKTFGVVWQWCVIFLVHDITQSLGCLLISWTLSLASIGIFLILFSLYSRITKPFER